MMLAYVDPAQVLRLVSEPWCKWLGVSAPQALGRPYEDVIGATRYARHRGHLTLARRGQATSSFAYSSIAASYR